MPDLVMGVDLGTEGARAGIFDAAGKCLGQCAAAYPTEHPQSGRAEQNPDDWWQALGQASQGALQAAGLQGADIAALCIDSTTCTAVALDSADNVLRPALLWMDVRSRQEAEQVFASSDPALRVNGGEAVSPEWMIPKALWLKRKEPDTYASAATICECQDYLNWRLTQKWCVSHMHASVRWHYQADHGGWPESLLAAAGLADLLDKWPSRIVAAGELVGELCQLAGDHLELAAGTPVFQGGPDACVGMLGQGVCEPGTLVLITGSAHVLIMLSASECYRPGIWGSYQHCPLPGCFLLEGGQTSSGSTIRWFKRTFCPGTSFEKLNAAAAKLRPGSEGLIALDHFQGNRMPYADPHSTGALVGLTLAHDAAHVYRALIEGVCMGTKAVVDKLSDALNPHRIVVAGGATNSALWMQIHADTLGRPLEVAGDALAPTLGCAMLAHAGIGSFASVPQACAQMAKPCATVEPAAASVEAYEKLYERYNKLYPALRSV